MLHVQTPSTTWKRVAKRLDLIGGDFEVVEAGVTFRGPISKIEKSGDMIHIRSPWCARRNPRNKEWSLVELAPHLCGYSIECRNRPFEREGETIHIVIANSGTCTLHPNSDHNLSASAVRGLAKNTDRLLALYPNLPFNRSTIEKVFLEKFFLLQHKVLATLPAEARLPDILALFRHESSAEKFLWFYIEEITGEVDVHQRVY